MKEVANIDKNEWKIVLVETIDEVKAVYYRIVNMFTLEIEDIPAYRLLDEVINNHKNITNMKCVNNEIVIIDSDGYESTNEIITIDRFDKEIPNIYEWCLRNGEFGTDIINKFDAEKNLYSASNYKINSHKKITWKCKKGHSIYCGFPTFISNKGECPICEMDKIGEVPSLSYWAHLTNNLDILKYYDNADNLEDSTMISWKAHKKVRFRQYKEDGTYDEVLTYLNNITVKNEKIGFEHEAINLTHKNDRKK